MFSKSQDDGLIPVFFFLLDAFRHDYLDEEITPFLYSCSKHGEYYSYVIPSSGFCERTEILTGMKPDESGNYTAIGYNPNLNQYRSIPFFSLLKKIEKVLTNEISSYNLGKNLYILYRRILNNYYFPHFRNLTLRPYYIPLSLLDFFALTEDYYPHNEENAFVKESILDQLKKNGKSFFYDSFTSLIMKSNGTDIDRLNIALDSFNKKQQDLYLIYQASPDIFGHSYGPNTNELKQELKRLDSRIKLFVKTIQQETEHARFIFLGDHGMSTVKTTLDVRKIVFETLKKDNIKLEKDFLIFLDSTIMRVWIINKALSKKIQDLLFNNVKLKKMGLFVNINVAREFNIPWNNKMYGDIIWVANEGIQIFPDFFHLRSPKKGMHGYLPTTNNAYGMAIVYGSQIEVKVVDKIDLSEINSLLKRLLNV